MVTIDRLEQVLKSKHGILTPEEFGILESSKLKAVSDFFSGAITAGTICWTGVSILYKSFPMKRHHDPALIQIFKVAFHMFFAAEGAVVYGRLKFLRALSSSADYILEQEGSRIRKELANLWITKSQIKPYEMQVFHKHFFVEEIYDDSTSDHPKLMPRYRNFFSDNVVHGQITDDCDNSDVSYSYSHDDSKGIAHGDSKEASDSARTKVNTRPIFMEDADPLDDLFGYGAPVEDIHPSITSNKPSGGVPNRCHKRSHRRRRMRRHEDLSNHEI